MPESDVRRHGLEALLATLPPNPHTAAGIAIQVQPGLGHINLRGNPDHAAFVQAAKTALQQELPLNSNTVTRGKHRIYWLGPNEWLILTPIDGASDLIVEIKSALLGQHASVTDLSGGQIAFNIAGPHVRDVLAKGCTLDLHEATFRSGACAQSGLAKANVLIGLVDDQPTFEIVVRRSFAEYVVLWLQDAGSEYDIEFSVI